MPIKIDSQITGFKVVNNNKPAPVTEEQKQSADIVHMHEKVNRPEMLHGSTYKIKTPDSKHALYITINDIVLNQGTEHELRRPFEVFINSKNLDHYQWIVALTRVMSAVFRKGGDVTFLVDEMKAVFDPQGGYFKKGGRFMPSMVAEIGHVIENHLQVIGLLQTEGLDDAQKQLIAAKRAEYEAQNKSNTATDNNAEFPATAQMCAKCHTKAKVMMDGCITCLNCGDSKCS